MDDEIKQGDTVYWRDYEYVYRATVDRIIVDAKKSALAEAEYKVTWLVLKNVACKRDGRQRWFSEKGMTGARKNECHVTKSLEAMLGTFR